jgi:hypothetical protein
LFFSPLGEKTAGIINKTDRQSALFKNTRIRTVDIPGIIADKLRMIRGYFNGNYTDGMCRLW